jgi:glycosyltransferase involved in cell wall biosynthesis
MRILKVVQAYDPFQEAGGPVVKVRALAHGLVHRGHEVTILTADLGIADRHGSNFRFEPSKWGWQSEQGGVHVIYLSSLARRRSLTFNPAVVGFCRHFGREFDIGHFYGLYDLNGPILGTFFRQYGNPYILEPMGMYRPIVRTIWLKQLWHRLPGKRLIAGARYLIATSEQERQELVEGGIEPSRIVIRRNGVEVPESLPERGPFRRALGLSDDGRLVLFLGRLVSKKNPDVLIEAFAQWRKESARGAGSVLVLAGPDEGDGYVAQLKRLVDRLKLGDSVRFVGPLYDDAKWRAYRDADVFVLPSRNENFGNTAAESAACGTPVIVTNSCGVASFVKNAGLVVYHTCADLSRALSELLDEPNLRERYREGCAQMAGSLSWTEPILEIERLYERCLSEVHAN